MKLLNQLMLRNRKKHLNQPKPRNTKVLTIAFVALILGSDALLVRHHTVIQATQEQRIRTYTTVQLSLYDGTDPHLPVLLAMDGLVYDISGGRKEFYDPGKPYHMLAGTDATTLLHIAGGDIIARKYHVVGRLVR